MDREEVFNTLLEKLDGNIQFLEDKPEETLNSTLKALWFKAYGTPLSADAASGMELPELSKEQLNTLNRLIQLRQDNTPLAYITGRQNFLDLEFITDQRALIPRKETELLGNKVLAIASEIVKTNENIKILDVCCGAGNLALSIAHKFSKAIVFGTDLSTEAVELSKENARMLDLEERVSFIPGDLFSAFESKNFYTSFDIIVCNPPYISTAKVSQMQSEISLNEPSLAFDGGSMGINLIQKLMREAPKFLAPYGWLAFEVGLGQGPFIAKLCAKTQCYSQIEQVEDNDGNQRVITARKI